MTSSNEGMIEVNGERLFYREWFGEAADAKPLILIHGNGGSVDDWLNIAPAMSGRFHVLAIDLRGHGYSAWVRDGDYSTQIMASDVARIIKAFGFESFSVVGHSMGGRVAIAYAASDPAGLEKLVIEDIRPEPHSLMGVPRPYEHFSSADDAVDKLGEMVPDHSDFDVTRYAMRMLRTEDGNRTWPFDRRMRDPNIDRGHLSAAEAWDAFLSIRVPTLVIRGELSELLTAQEGARMAAEGQDCRLVTIEGAGHGVHHEQPERYLAELYKFL